MYLRTRALWVGLAMLVLLVLCAPAFCQTQALKGNVANTTIDPTLGSHNTNGRLMPRTPNASFSPDRVVTASIGGMWKVVDGSTVILDCGTNQNQAEQAVAVIKYFGMDSQYLIGGIKGMQYYLAKGAVPNGPMSGEYCTSIDPKTIQIVKVSDAVWQVKASNGLVLASLTSEKDAKDASDTVKYYGFTCVGWVGGTTGPMMYFRTGDVLHLTVRTLLSASPAPSTSKTPSANSNGNASIYLSGSIFVSGPCLVKYNYVADDGTSSNGHSMQYTSPGTYTLPQLMMNFHNHPSGWVMLQVTSPFRVDSNKATFDVSH